MRISFGIRNLKNINLIRIFGIKKNYKFSKYTKSYVN